MFRYKPLEYLIIQASSTLYRNLAARQDLYLGITSTRSVWNATHLVLDRTHHGNLRRKVHFPEEYTVEPLDNTHLAGRDPDTGRVIVKTLGGGIKHKYHWIDWIRAGPTEEGKLLEEKVIQIMKCGCRTSDIALVGIGDRLKYILATLHMKAGDILYTSSYIPLNDVLANEGDAYPLGALPVGTEVNCVERSPGLGGFYVHAAGTSAVILRKVDDRVIIKLPSKLEVSLNKRCMATVGRLSRPEHSSIPIGSPNRLRELGFRPRSGLFQKKDGRFGRKIKKPPPVMVVKEFEEKKKVKTISLTLPFLNMKTHPRG